MRLLENILWLTGFSLVGLFLAAQAWAEYASRRDIASVIDANAAQMHLAASVSTDGAGADEPTADLTVKPEDESGGAIAVLRIPSLALEVPVSYGTTERVLLRGAGLIEESPKPGSSGNVSIAAHRDSHFRPLKDISIGDLIELEAIGGSRSYRVTELLVVEPDAVHVLDDVGAPVLTLVTCYPFFFVGHAPQRFIVRAVAADVVTQDPQEKHHATQD